MSTAFLDISRGERAGLGELPVLLAVLVHLLHTRTHRTQATQSWQWTSTEGFTNMIIQIFTQSSDCYQQRLTTHWLHSPAQLQWPRAFPNTEHIGKLTGDIWIATTKNKLNVNQAVFWWSIIRVSLQQWKWSRTVLCLSAPKSVISTAVYLYFSLVWVSFPYIRCYLKIKTSK